MVSYCSVLTAVSKVSDFYLFNLKFKQSFTWQNWNNHAIFICSPTVWWFFTGAVYQIIARDHGYVLQPTQVLIRQSVTFIHPRTQVIYFLSCFFLLQLPWKGRRVYWAVPCHAVYRGLAPAGLCVVLWETAGVRHSTCVRKQSKSLPGAHEQSVTQYQEQSSGAHRTPGGTRCVYLVVVVDEEIPPTM